jgi:hypothetical protein
MTIQVLDGGLAQAPVYDVPQYPEQGFDCKTTGELLDAVAKTGLKPVGEAREHWVTANDWQKTRSLMSVSVFNAQGEEIASFNPYMQRGQFHAKPDGRGRIWGKQFWDTTNPRDISHLIRG